MGIALKQGMDQEHKGYGECWKITVAIASDSEVQELLEDDANCQAMVGAYVYDLVWDAASARLDDDD
ncbi:MAG: hypothetical protein J2P54_05940 [Bradyrhizobiaceae bacterium]|nr:hypothetical protein [Bradyrhizobiaceae bacterium]